MGHTKEPWLARIDEYAVDIVQEKTGFGICDIGTRKQLKNSDYPNNVAECNAHRIVECVNALAGIENPAEFVAKARNSSEFLIIQNQAVSEISFERNELREKVKQLESDKAKLLEALKETSNFLQEFDEIEFAQLEYNEQLITEMEG